MIELGRFIHLSNSHAWQAGIAALFAGVLVVSDSLGGTEEVFANIISAFLAGILLLGAAYAHWTRRRTGPLPPALFAGLFFLVALGAVQSFHGFTHMSFSGIAFEPGTFISFATLWGVSYATYVFSRAYGEKFLRASCAIFIVALVAYGILFLTNIFAPAWSAQFSLELPKSQEYRPSAAESFHITLLAYGDSLGNVLWGTGLHAYPDAWARYRPQEINLTPAWNQDAPTAYGLILTLAVTAGSIVVVAFTIVLFSLMRSAFVHRAALEAEGYVRALSIIGAALLASFVMHTPHLGAFVVLGWIFGAVLSILRADSAYPRAAPKFGTFVTIAAVLFGTWLTAAAPLRFLSLDAYSHAAALDAELVDFPLRVEALKASGERYGENILALRGLAQITYDEAQELSRQSSVTREERDLIESYMQSSLSYSRQAHEHGDTKYRSYVLLGESEVFLGVLLQNREHFETGISWYKNAEQNAQGHPLAFLREAQALFVSGDISGAFKNVHIALALKPDYEEAREFATSLGAHEAL